MNEVQIVGAPVVMRKKGRETDAQVLREVRRKPGSAVHDIAVKLGWSNGRVDGSVNRLISQGKVEVRHHLRRGALVKKVYPLHFVPTPPNIIEIPMNMIEGDLWKDTVNVYALSRSTIALSPIRVEEWEEKALRKENIATTIRESVLHIELSSFLSDFYQLENSETSISTTAGFAIVTIESILPVGLPPSYPAEVAFEVTRVVMVEKIKGIATYAPAEVDVDLLKGATNVPIPYEPQLIQMVKKVAKEKRRMLTESSGTSEVLVEVI